MRITKYSLKMQGEDRSLMLVKEKSTNYPRHKQMDSPQKVADMLDEVFGLPDMAEEYMYLVACTAGRVSGVFELAHGSTEDCYFTPREIYKRVFLCNATQFMLVHNHPSGNITPSKVDLKMIERMNEIGEIMGCRMTDFIIVGRKADGCGTDYYSAYEYSLIK